VSMMRCVRRRAFVVILFLTSLTTAAWAQSPPAYIPEYGSLRGLVQKESRRILSDVLIRIQHEETGQWWETRSNIDGFYEFLYLPPGRYRLIATADSFEPVEAIIEVRAGFREAYDPTLPLRRVEDFTVVGDSARTDPAIATRLSRRELDWLPMPPQGRTVQSLLMLTPGIAFTPQTGTHAEFSPIGQRRLMSGLWIDGVSADLAADAVTSRTLLKKTGSLPTVSIMGSTETVIQFAAIDELTVSPVAATPEYRRLPGALTSIVTRAGTNDFRGGAFAEGQPSAFVARSWWEKTGREPTRRQQYMNTGGFIGGPVIRDRLFLHLASEAHAIDRTTRATIDVPSAARRERATTLVQSLLSAVPLPSDASASSDVVPLTMEFPLQSSLKSVGLRVDFTAGRHRAFFRGNHGDSTGDGLDPDTRLPATSYTSTETTDTNTATFGLTSLWPSLLHDLRANVSLNQASVVASPARVGGVTPLPLATLAPGFAPADTWVRVVFLNPGVIIDNGQTMGQERTQVQFLDTWTLLLGSHELRVGIDYRRLTSAISPATNSLTYRFFSIEQAMQGVTAQVNVQRVEPTGSHRDMWGAFWQDTVRLQRLSITFGARAGVTPAPVSGRSLHWRLERPDALPRLQEGSPWKPWITIAPSISGTYAFSMKEGRATTLRAGWGRSYDTLAVPGASVFTYSSATRLIPFSQFPAAPEALQVPSKDPFSPGDTSGHFAFPGTLRPPRTDMMHVGLERELGRKHQLDVSYVHAAGANQLYWHVANLDSTFPVRYTVNNDGRSRYDGLLLQFTRRLSERGMALVAYTLSRALDNDSGENAEAHLPPAIMQPSRDWANADYDQTHNLAFAGSYRLPGPRRGGFVRAVASDWDLEVAGVWRSGVPLPITVLVDLGAGVFFAMRPDLAPVVPVWIEDPAAGPHRRRLNPDAFLPPAAVQGTMPRNIYRAPTVYQLDVGLKKLMYLRGTVRAELRIRAYNISNRANAGRPISDLGDSRFGETLQSYADDQGTGRLLRGGLDPLRQIGVPRSFRGEFRLTF